MCSQNDLPWNLCLGWGLSDSGYSETHTYTCARTRTRAHRHTRAQATHEQTHALTRTHILMHSHTRMHAHTHTHKKPFMHTFCLSHPIHLRCSPRPINNPTASPSCSEAQRKGDNLPLKNIFREGSADCFRRPSIAGAATPHFHSTMGEKEECSCISPLPIMRITECGPNRRKKGKHKAARSRGAKG